MLTRGRRGLLHQKPPPSSPRGEVAGFRSEKAAALSWNLQALLLASTPLVLFYRYDGIIKGDMPPNLNHTTQAIRTRTRVASDGTAT
jgi:hypothetical protein